MLGRIEIMWCAPKHKGLVVFNNLRKEIPFVWKTHRDLWDLRTKWVGRAYTLFTSNGSEMWREIGRDWWSVCLWRCLHSRTCLRKETEKTQTRGQVGAQAWAKSAREKHDNREREDCTSYLLYDKSFQIIAS